MEEIKEKNGQNINQNYVDKMNIEFSDIYS